MTSIVTGVVVSSVDYKETDRFYVIYTRERGKMRIMGKGTRKFKSKLAAHMTPFTELQIMIAHGKIWPKLASVERISDFPLIRENLQLFGLGLGLNELIYRAVQDGESDEGLYDYLIEAYRWIQTLPELSSDRLRFIYSAITLKWLVMIGFGPHSEACVSCNVSYNDILKPYISVSNGGLVCGDCVLGRRLSFSDAREITFEMLAALRFMVVSSFEVLLTKELTPLLESLADIQDEFIHYHLDRDLRIPVFLDKLSSDINN